MGTRLPPGSAANLFGLVTGHATLAHELTHWTKHEKRLARDFGRKRFGDEGYAMEELVAELGAAFVCADLALTPAPRAEHAAYIPSWLKALKDDKRAILAAAAHAQRAADYLARFSTPEAAAEPDGLGMRIEPLGVGQRSDRVGQRNGHRPLLAHLQARAKRLGREESGGQHGEEDQPSEPHADTPFFERRPRGGVRR